MIEKLKIWLRQWWLLAIPVVLALIAVGSYIYTFHDWPTREVPAAWGTFGDYFGGLLNPVIAACTLFVAVRVWQLQKIELNATQKALQEQARTAEQQRGEQRFFDLLNLYLASVNSLRYSYAYLSLGSRQEISEGKHAIQSWLQHAIEYEGKPDSAWDFAEVNFIEHTSQFDMLFAAYFRTLTLILENLEALTGEQHPTFARMLRAQLSHVELTLIGLCILFHDDAQRSIPDFEKYGMLKHLADSRLREEILQKHPRTTYGFYSMDQDVAEGVTPC